MTKTIRSLIVVGNLESGALASAEEAASILGVAFKQVPSDRVAEILPDDALAVIVGPDDGARACVEIRTQPTFSHVPVLVAKGQGRNNLFFIELFQWGADDAVDLCSSKAIVRRLRPLLSSVFAPRPPRGESARAIVASADGPWASVVGRVFHNGGIPTTIVEDARAVVDRANEAQIIVATDDLGPFGAATAVTHARQRGSTTPWIIVAPPKRMAAARAATSGISHTVVVNAFAPPENVLFVANDLLRTQTANDRASSRLLYGATVSYRAAGHEEDEQVGFSYNVSAGGLYVRTLAPPEARQEVWLELWAPRCSRVVRLSATVAWRRLFGPNEGATVPPGFGARVVDGLAGDLERWRIGCELLAAEDKAVLIEQKAAEPHVKNSLLASNAT